MVGQQWALASRLLLNTNTLTPLLKRLEVNGLVIRKRTGEDERVVRISLTKKGRSLKRRAASVPVKLLENLDYPVEDLLLLRSGMTRLLGHLANQAGKDTGD